MGPIGVLCIQRTIAHGRYSGLLTGLGAATADGLYGAVAAFGLKIVSNFLMGAQFLIRLVGGLFLFYLAVRTFLAKPAQKAGADSHKGLLSDYFSTLFLTAANPLTILSFIAVNSPGWDLRARAEAEFRRSSWCLESFWDRHCGGCC